MKLILGLCAVALALCLVPIGLWVYTFHHLGLPSVSAEWANFGSYIGGVLSPLLAFASFVGLMLAFGVQRREARRLKRESDNKNYFEHAVRSLERAYEALVTDSSKPEIKLERLAWLTCARLLLSAEDVSKRISSDSDGLRALYEGENEYWRHQSYELFDEPGVRSASRSAGFFGGPTPHGNRRLEERSIRVIYEFSQWPEGKMDPIDKVPKYTKDELAEMKGNMAGVRDYILTMTRFKKDMAVNAEGK